MPITVLPGSEIPIHCFKCTAPLDVEPLQQNPFPTPVKDRQEWTAFKFVCPVCGFDGMFQYRTYTNSTQEETQE